MSFLSKINIIDEALISKEEIKADPEMIETLSDNFDLKKYKGVRKNILRPLFKKIADTYGIPLLNNGKTLIFDFQSLMIEKDTTNSRQVSTAEKTLLSNLLFRYNYVFDENLFFVGNAKKRNGQLESLINIFDKIKEELKEYQKYQNEKDRNTVKEKKIKDDIEKLKTDKKFLAKTEEEREKIKKSKEETLVKLTERNVVLKNKLENLQKDEEVFTKLQEKIYKYKDINYKILITYIPWRVAAMSTFSASGDTPWSSCMNLSDGVNKHFVGSSISNGAFVAYLIRPGDEENINNPIARVLIKPFIKIENDEEEEDDYEDDEDYENKKKLKYAEIDYIDKSMLDTNVFWYVDLVYPRGQHGTFRSKVVSIFNKVNSNVEKGEFVISKGQYTDSKDKVEIDDVFKYVNDGDYSDIETKDNDFITKMIENYTFEFFSNWPEDKKIPESVVIRSSLKIENMDIRKFPEGFTVTGNLTIDNINVRKLSKIKCKTLIIKNNNNLEIINDCKIKSLYLEKNKKLSNIVNNQFSNLEIVRCEKIEKLEKMELKSLKITKKEINNPFVFDKNIKIEDELKLENFKVSFSDLFFLKEIKNLQLKNVEIDQLSGNYDYVYIGSGCKINTIKNLSAKYVLEISTLSEVKNLENVKIESTFNLENKTVETIKNLSITQKYESPVSRYVGTTIECKSLREIVNVSAEIYLLLYDLKDIKIIRDITCDSDIKIAYCDLSNFNNLKNLNINCKKLIFEKSKIKTIKDLEIDELNIIESEIEEINNITCKKEFEVNKSKIKNISSITAQDKIFIYKSNIENISKLKAKNVYLNEIENRFDFDLNNEKIETLKITRSRINSLKNASIDSLSTSDYGFIDVLENVQVKKEIKIFGDEVTEIGPNVIIGEEGERNRFNISFIDLKKVSKDFKIYGDAFLSNDDFEVLPFMTVKGKLVIQSDSIKDVIENSEIDEIRIGGNRKILRDDLDKEKILKKIKTLSES